MVLDEASKSERKRDATRLQNLGRALTELNAAQLSEVGLSDELAKAIADYHRFFANEAKRDTNSKMRKNTTITLIDFNSRRRKQTNGPIWPSSETATGCCPLWTVD